VKKDYKKGISRIQKQETGDHPALVVQGPGKPEISIAGIIDKKSFGKSYEIAGPGQVKIKSYDTDFFSFYSFVQILKKSLLRSFPA